MKKITHSNLLKNVILILIKIAGRRTSEVISSAYIKAILLSLREKYQCIDYINIKDIIYHEGSPLDAIQVNPKIETIEHKIIGEIIESIIRILCMDIEEDTGLYFINELKTRLPQEYLSTLHQYGVDLELLKLEQKHLHEQLERRKRIIHHEDETEKAELQVTIPDYSWSDVATFKYRNNICFLYNRKGQLLDRLHINKLMEYYVRTLTDYGKLVLKKEKIELSEAAQKLLQLLYEKDLDEEAVLYYLKISKIELQHIIQQLLRYDYLHYISPDEIKLTEKGIIYVEERKEKIEDNIETETISP
jgi:hypothetical protein